MLAEVAVAHCDGNRLTNMLSLIAAVVQVAQTGASFVLRTESDAVDLFRADRFKVVKLGGARNFEVSRGGDRSSLYIPEPQADPANGKSIQFLALNWKYAFPKSISEDILACLPHSAPNPWIYESGLDGSLTLRSGIYLPNGITRTDAVKQLDGLWQDRKTLDGLLIRPQHGVDWVSNRPIAEAILNEQAIVHQLGQADVYYLIRKWSWMTQKGYGGTGASWALLSDISGQDVWFRGTNFPVGDPNWGKILLIGDLPLPLGDPEKWIADHGKNVGSKKLQVSYQSTEVNRRAISLSLVEEIDPSKGIRLSEFKARALDFAMTKKKLSEALR